jgi:tetratricopeptide (TPR) repeat protein
MPNLCRACGFELTPRAKFCAECGARVALPAGETGEARPRPRTGLASVATLPPAPPETSPPAMAAVRIAGHDPRHSRPSSTAATLPPASSSAVTLPPAGPIATADGRGATLVTAWPDDAPAATGAPSANGASSVNAWPDDAPATRDRVVHGSSRDGSLAAAGDEPQHLGRGTVHRPRSQATKILTGAAAAASGPLEPGQSFGPRYHIKKLLGLGGMGAVYRAWDTELSVDVAIKLIRPEIIADPAAAAEIQRRFKRELLLARLVTHRNVVRIHDLGEISGIKYITMSFVDGIDLASILEREQKLTVQRVLRIARQVCAGLVAAHSAGVVHRDLKPANVMVGKGDEALIMDFGIARMTADPGGDVETGVREAFTPVGGSMGARYAGMTRMGSMVGTVEYMPPEQARGEQVDQRADVYAFGLMLYDMLAGPVRTAQAASPLAELEARSVAPPPSLHSLVKEVPEACSALIAKCLLPNRDERYQTSAELQQALERLDDDGARIPAWRTWGVARLAGVAAGVLAVSSAGWWYFGPEPPPPAKDPVSVVIADIRNATPDKAFERTLEPVLKLSLESADFITAYSRAEVRRTLGVPVPEVFDEQAARELAVKQGLGVVIGGEIAPEGEGFRLTLSAVQPITGNVIATAQSVAASKAAVLAETGDLADELRQALGDDTRSDETQRFAMETLTATSLEVVHDYGLAMEALAGSQFDVAKENFAKAVKGDPTFGLAYAGMAIASSNMGRQQEAQDYVAEAVRHVDRMTERERFRTRGLYYLVTNDYPSCVAEYDALIARYRSDAAARNNLALCSTGLRDLPRALTEMKEAVRILPNRALYRVNLALYAAYAGDFDAAEPEAVKAREMSPLGHVPLGFAQVGLGRLDDARATAEAFAKVNALGASHAASVLGDLAAYEGRYSEAVRILAAGAKSDLAAGDAERAAAKYAAIAHAELSRDRKDAALRAARRAMELSPAPKIRFLAGRVFAQAGAFAEAREIVDALSKEVLVEPRSYAKIVAAELELAGGEPRMAVVALQEAVQLLDAWITRYTLGRAYLEAGMYPQADSEFDRAIVRRGESLALFLDQEPTYAFFPRVHYYQGRVREGLKTVGYAESYRRYLAIREAAGEDPLLDDARKRAAAAP